MLNRIEKIKTSVWKYLANNKFKFEADDWKLVSFPFELSKYFYMVNIFTWATRFSWFRVKNEKYLFFVEKCLSAEEVKKAEVLSWWNSNKKKRTHLASFLKRHLSASLSSVYSERLLSEVCNLNERKQSRLLEKLVKLFIIYSS